MLAAHPLLSVPDESPFIREVYRELVRRGAERDVELAWRLIRRERFFMQWMLDPARVEDVLARHRPGTYVELIRALFAAHAEVEGKPLSADKTPSHAYCFEWFAERFPGSRFVHLLRDPREACMSLAVQPWHRGGVARSAQVWTRTVRRARQAGARLGPRFLEIRYEDLVVRPRGELERLCAFARVPFAEETLNYPRRARLLPDAHHRLSGSSPRPGVRCWRKELDRADIALIESIAGETMREVGYSPCLDRAPLGVWARSRLTSAWLDARNRAGRWLQSRQPPLR
jgi:hypothetical protein